MHAMHSVSAPRSYDGVSRDQSSPSPLRNARARAFLMRYTRCEVCDVEGTDVYVRFCTGVQELGNMPKRPRGRSHAYV
jgi:hypothetical protein